jgi:hypothetical protein
VRREDDAAPDRRIDLPAARTATGEKHRSAFVGNVLHALRRIFAARGLGQQTLVHVGGKYLDIDRRRVIRRSFGKNNGDGVRLFAAGATGHPHPDRAIFGMRPMDDFRRDLPGKTVEDSLIAKEIGDADQ